MNFKLIAVCLALVLITACQSTPKVPQWYLNPGLANNASLVAVGEGRTLAYAKQKAMSALNQQLWTEVKSKGQSRNIANNINGDEHYQQLNDFSVNTKTSAVVLNGVVFSHAEQIGEHFYVEAMIDKSNIKAQLLAELTDYNQQIAFELDNLSKVDPLVWWLKNADTDLLEQKINHRLSMLLALSPTESTPNNLISKLKAKVAEVHSNIKVAIIIEPSNPLMKKIVAAHFAPFGINVVSNLKQPFSHKLILDVEQRNSYISDIYISTLQTNLVLKNKSGHIISSNEIIANANSVTSYARANEGAIRHFSAKLKGQGFWKALGL